MTTKKLIVKPILTDDDISFMEGEYYDSKHFHTIIDYDADIYTDKGILLAKFRKNVISPHLTNLALASYRTQAKIKNSNRGASAGILDENKLPKYATKNLINQKKFRTNYCKPDGTISKASLSNLSPSNIAGYFDKPIRGSNSNIPCRLTSFTRQHSKLWETSLPFLQRCDMIFFKLIPDRHKKQWMRSNLTPQFNINETAFSTITLNYSWRTALHKDSGDFPDGFGNLIVIEDDKNPNSYRGCYTGFPQYGIAFDVRTGDFLAMDVHQWHCNTEFIDPNNISPKTSKEILKEWNYNRLSIVCYLRDNMINCLENPIKKDHINTLDKKYRDKYY